jgi:hypothetical protein
MIYYDIVTWVMKLFRVLVYDNYYDFQHVTQRKMPWSGPTYPLTYLVHIISFYDSFNIVQKLQH